MFVFHWITIQNNMRFDEKSTKIYIPQITTVLGWRFDPAQKWIEKHIQCSKYYKVNNLVMSSDWSHVILPFQINLIYLQLFVIRGCSPSFFFSLVLYCIRKFFSKPARKKTSLLIYKDSFFRVALCLPEWYFFDKIFPENHTLIKNERKLGLQRSEKEKLLIKENNLFWGTICD